MAFPQSHAPMVLPSIPVGTQKPYISIPTQLPISMVSQRNSAVTQANLDTGALSPRISQPPIVQPMVVVNVPSTRPLVSNAANAANVALSQGGSIGNNQPILLPIIIQQPTQQPLSMLPSVSQTPPYFSQTPMTPSSIILPSLAVPSHKPQTYTSQAQQVHHTVPTTAVILPSVAPTQHVPTQHVPTQHIAIHHAPTMSTAPTQPASVRLPTVSQASTHVQPTQIKPMVLSQTAPTPRALPPMSQSITTSSSVTSMVMAPLPVVSATHIQPISIQPISQHVQPISQQRVPPVVTMQPISTVTMQPIPVVTVQPSQPTNIIRPNTSPTIQSQVRPSLTYPPSVKTVRFHENINWANRSDASNVYYPVPPGTPIIPARSPIRPLTPKPIIKHPRSPTSSYSTQTGSYYTSEGLTNVSTPRSPQNPRVQGL